MFILNLIFYPILYLYLNKNVQAITINTVAIGYYGREDIYRFMTNEFNNYSKENNLNITLSLNTFTPENSTQEIRDYESTLEILFKKGSNKYDFIIYDNVYTPKFCPYLLNLNKYIPKNHIDTYNSQILSNVGSCKNEIVGLPVILDFTLLYSNRKLLNKYKKNIPTTWNELLETASYILEKEKQLNNTDIMGFSGLINGKIKKKRIKNIIINN
ncbi:hypothetical protein LY90DRAFT_513452 [Neocallimastix californiae]|uniref:Periplasmic binding protein-like II n=1 Tax=Neocallimastix californiae TaxID=1754190 RepID=A0A1Y2AY38_9FUNG|nr:hypothetical protein LY90DRAFT_513452 [Neocallimastix californiae]|eukprot:ORY27406.1 hypothetical protein LY90DRAFT_513452 [Neocallimastix californiae]